MFVLATVGVCQKFPHLARQKIALSTKNATKSVIAIVKNTWMHLRKKYIGK